MILLLDFEKIVVEINPESGINKHRIEKLDKRDRSNVKLVIAEDSPLLRKLIEDTLKEAGFRRMEFFENGKDAYNYLEKINSQGKEISREVQMIITDIEMPQMDGHHLTRKVKEDSKLGVFQLLSFLP